MVQAIGQVLREQDPRRLHGWTARENATIITVICLTIGAKLIAGRNHRAGELETRNVCSRDRSARH
jgi:hypothetical protein